MSAQPATAIYDQLISERGDIPAQVRAAAEAILRELEYDMAQIRPSGRGRSEAGLERWFG
jgi:hypothetical protein